jgi:hypothetical protein
VVHLTALSSTFSTSSRHEGENCGGGIFVLETCKNLDLSRLLGHIYSISALVFLAWDGYTVRKE